jgi:hypothetical protein
MWFLQVRKCWGNLSLTKEQIDQLDSSAKIIEQIWQLRQNVDSFSLVPRVLHP